MGETEERENPRLPAECRAGLGAVSQDPENEDDFGCRILVSTKGDRVQKVSDTQLLVKKYSQSTIRDYNLASSEYCTLVLKYSSSTLFSEG